MGLLGGIARTAVVAGTATAVSNRVSRRQGERWAEKDQSAYAQQQYAEPQYAPAPQAASAAAPEDDMIVKLRELAELHEQGVLTDDEFSAMKAKLLAT